MTTTALPGPNAEALRNAERRESLALGALAAPGLLLIGVVALAPILWLFWLSFRKGDDYTLEHYVRLLHPNYLLSLQTTFELTFLVTAICVLIGYPLAYLIAQVRERTASILLLFVLLVTVTILTTLGQTIDGFFNAAVGMFA